MRAPHFPSTTAPRDMGDDASRRRMPLRRSMVRITAPEVNSTSNVNITMVPGTDCSKPTGGSRRAPALWTSSLSLRGSAAKEANCSGVGWTPVARSVLTSASTGINGAGDAYLVEIRVEILVGVSEANLRRMAGEDGVGEALRDFEPPAVRCQLRGRIGADHAIIESLQVLDHLRGARNPASQQVR